MRRDGQEDNVKLALEPEAASINCRDDVMRYWRATDHPEIMRYIVADCGGGTADFTVHDLNITTKKIGEAHPSSGIACGGVNVDQEILSLVKEAIGQANSTKIEDWIWLHFERTKIQDAKRNTEDYEDKVKIQFTHQLCKAITTHNIPMTSLKVAGVTFCEDDGKLVVQKHVFERCYKATLGKISNHLRDLATAVPRIRCVLLVGGFAESGLLRNHLKRTMPDYSFAYPEEASLAVLKGALGFGQHLHLIVSRVSKYTYGVDKCERYDPQKHHPREPTEFPDGRFVCEGVFDKIVEVNQRINLGEKQPERVYKTCSADQTAMEFRVYRSDEPNVQFVDDSCLYLCTVRIQMPNPNRVVERKVRVQIDFSQTHLNFSARNLATDEAVLKEIEWHCF